MLSCKDVTGTRRQVASVDVSPPAGSVIVGQTRGFNATPRDEAGRPVRRAEVAWSTSDSDVARVDENGVVTGMAIGSTSITAKAGTLQGTAAVTVLERSEVDRPDEIAGPQVHVLYVISQDGVDNSLDTEGKILNSLGAVQGWLAAQTGGRTLRLDLYQGIPDESFLQLEQSDAEMVASGKEAENVISDAIVAAGFDDPEKLYIAYYDGAVDPAVFCTVRKREPVTMVVFFLEECTLKFAQTPASKMRNAEAVLVHDILHALGYVADGAPHRVTGSPHVDDDPRDLMYFQHQYQFPDSLLLDFGRDDYYGENVPEGVLNFAESPYLN